MLLYKAMIFMSGYRSVSSSLDLLHCHIRTVKSSSILYGIKWRLQQGLNENPTSYGPLTNLPDYSYQDGRPVPLGANQRKRLMKHKEYAAKIVQLSKEVDFAVERHKKMEEEREAFRQDIINKKLKQKGEKLLE